VRGTTGEHTGSFDARGMRIAIVASRFNEAIGKRLVDGALDCLKRHHVSDDDVSLTWVPGAFEIPLVASRLAASGAHDAVITLGAVIRGETAHFDLVAGHAATGIGRASLDTGVPISFGVLATENTEQAEARAGGKHGNMGFEAAMAAIEMASLLSSLPKKED
jgi:6,7-dimethyl-8-ribityllumazine synthase